jgi:hypothetical protein
LREINFELIMLSTFLGLFIIFFILVYFLLFIPLIEKGKLLKKAIFPEKIPKDAIRILKEHNITCFGYSCFSYPKKVENKIFPEKRNKIDCWITLGRIVEENNESYCLISGRSFGINCIRRYNEWECVESAFSPYEYEKDMIKILYWDLPKRECCYLVNFTNNLPSYECFPSTLMNSTMELPQ